MKRRTLIPLIWLLVSWVGHDAVIRGASAATTAVPQQQHNGAVPGQARSSRTAASEPGAESRTSGYDLALGEKVFNDTCLTCHGKGTYDAPVLGNAEDWEPRLQQDLDTLIGHALHGHRRMPPKGGFFRLTDQEVAAAVAYAVDNGEKILAAMKKEQLARRCDPVNNLDQCSAAEIRDMLTIQMLWLLGGGGE